MSAHTTAKNSYSSEVKVKHKQYTLNPTSVHVPFIDDLGNRK